MKKTYIAPASLTVQLRGRDALLQSVSGNSIGLGYGGDTGTSGIISADVKEKNPPINDVNVWDDEW